MTVSPKNAVAFVESHGIVLESGHGPVPSLAETVVGARIRGSWWGHTSRHDILAAFRTARESPDVLVCRLLDGKVTYIHRRLWSALVRLADKLDVDRLAAIHDEPIDSGGYQVKETGFPDWVPPDVREAAEELSEEEAVSRLHEQRFALPVIL